MYDYQVEDNQQEEDSSIRETVVEEGQELPANENQHKLMNSSNNKDNTKVVMNSSPENMAAQESTGRSRRKVRDYTGRYSLTHKGMLATQQSPKNSASKTSIVSEFTTGANQSGKRQSSRNVSSGNHPNGSANANLNKNTSGQSIDPIQQQGLQRAQSLGQQSNDQKPQTSIKKSNGPKTAQQCLESISNMFAFDWSLKEIGNLKNSPQIELANSQLIFWFYVCSQYFPFRAVEISRQSVEAFVEPILEKLKPNINNKLQNIDSSHQLKQEIVGSSSLKQLDSAVDLSVNETMEINNNLKGQPIKRFDSNDEGALEHLLEETKNGNGETLVNNIDENEEPENPAADSLPQYVRNLFLDKQMRKFKKFIKEMDFQLIQQSFLKPPSQTQSQPGGDSSQVSKFEKIVELIQSEVEQLTQPNRQLLTEQYLQFKKIFDEALAKDLAKYEPDSTVYRGDRISDYGQEFLSQLDPRFVQEIYENMSWYLEKYREIPFFQGGFNEILLNTVYPSRQEKHFLEHVEQSQQRKNDDKYKKILQEMRKDEISSEELLKKLKNAGGGANSRAIGAQEDAQCVICNSGDYEDEDMIVFCGNCNIPVHQSCYGIEQLPEEDWICYNCQLFGLKRGLMVTCLLCPKKGGAMKPTNICTPNHTQLRKQQITQQQPDPDQSKGRSITRKKNDETMAAEQFFLQPPIDKRHFLVGENEDARSNITIANALRKEQEFWAEIWHVVELRKEKLQKTGSTSIIPNEEDELSDANLLFKVIQRLQEIELNFLPGERETQIPDDYSFFLQRNEVNLEAQANDKDSCFVPTQFEWVHLSCATWIPGLTIKPKSTIRLNKIDEKRFQLQCIICFKKDGACMQCQSSRCQIAFHIECARRANYCMEIEKRGEAGQNSSGHLINGKPICETKLGNSFDNKIYKVFCEKHRPLKVVKEMEERDQQTIEEIQRFCKIVDKCLDLDYRHQLKPRSHRLEKRKERERKLREIERERELIRQLEIQARLHAKTEAQRAREQRIIEARQQKLEKKMQLQEELQRRRELKKMASMPKERPLSKAAMREIARREREKVKKWREKDKKQLFEAIKERYLQYRKMKVAVVRVDTMRKIRRQQMMQQSQNTMARKRSQKRNSKMAQEVPQISLNNNLNQPILQQQPFNQPVSPEAPFKIVIPNFGYLPQPTANQQKPEQTDEELKITLDEESKGLMSLAADDDALTAGDMTHTTKLLGPDEGIYYKFGNPLYMADTADWTVTLSRNDFPWHEICFAPFTARDCFEKYTSMVRDPQTFLKKVLGNKDKYKKIMEGQMQILPPNSAAQEKAAAENPSVYCRCKGAVVSELFVKCDGEQECQNGSWLHPQCTTDLKEKTKAELDAIEEWYCEDCVARIHKEEMMHNEEDEEEEEDIEVQIDQEDIQMQEQVEALDQEIDNIDLEIDQDMLIIDPNQEQPHDNIADILMDRENPANIDVAMEKEESFTSSSYDEEDDESSSD